jgi:hypothetical protein
MSRGPLHTAKPELNQGISVDWVTFLVNLRFSLYLFKCTNYSLKYTHAELLILEVKIDICKIHYINFMQSDMLKVHPSGKSHLTLVNLVSF